MNAMSTPRGWGYQHQFDFGSGWLFPPMPEAVGTADSGAAADGFGAVGWAFTDSVNGASGAGRSTLLTQTLVGSHYDFSGDRNIDAVLIGSKWTSLSQTFSFPSAGSRYVGYTTGENTTGFSAFNAAQKTAARYALGLVSEYTQVVFTEITETASVHADHRFADTTSSGVPSAYGNFPSNDFAAGDAWFNLSQPYYGTPAVGNWGQATIMHEIGHTMGLKHGMDNYTNVDLSADLFVAGPRFGSRSLATGFDGQPYSLMTYRGAIGETINNFEGDGFNQPQTYMQFDIAALQFMYGANYGASANNTASVYTFSPTTGEMFINGVGQGAPTSNIVFRTVWDGGGNDTYDLTNYTTPMNLDLQPGHWLVFDTDATGGLLQRANNSPLTGTAYAPGNVANALLANGDIASLIENVSAGSGNDSVTGNVADNVIYGYLGNDTIRGLAGNDTAWFDGLVGASAVTLLGPDHYQVSGPDGTDQLYGIERAQFGVPAVTNVALDSLLPAGSVLTIGTSMAGTIAAAGNHAYYATTLISGVTYVFNMEGAQSAGTTLNDPYLALYSDDATVAAFNDDGGIGRNAYLSYTPSATHTYWLDARDFASGIGTFTLSGAVADDYGSVPGGAGTLAVGAALAGTIDSGGDTDWFAITLTAGQAYEFDLLGSPTGDGTLGDPELRLLKTDGTVQVATDNDGGVGLNAAIGYTATASGTYFLSAQGHGGATGSYVIAAVVADDYGATPSGAGAIGVGGSVAGTIDSGSDLDWFAVSLTAGITYRFDLRGSPTSDGTLGNPELRLLGSDGAAQVAADDDGGVGANASLGYTPGSSGTYYLSAQGHGGSTGTYVLTAAVADDFGDTPAGAGSLAMGGVLSGTIDTGSDRDWFAVGLTGGTTYWFELRGAALGDGTLVDPELHLRTADGHTVAIIDDAGGSAANAFISYTPAADETVYLDAHSQSGGTGTYVVSAAVADDYSDVPFNGGTVAFGTPLTASIGTAGDTDMFTLALTAGVTYWLEMRGAPTGDGTLADPLLQLRGDDGVTLIASDDNGGNGSNAFISFTPALGGNYELLAAGAGGATGSYVVSATIADDYSDGVGAAGTLAIEGSIGGTIEVGGDRDWFAVDLVAGTTYWFGIEGSATGGGSLVDPYLALIGNDGLTTVAADDNSGAGGNAFMSFTPGTGGRYYLQSVGQGGIGTYTVTAQVVDDYAGSPTAGPALGVGGSILAAVDFSGDRDWVPVSLTAGKHYWFNLEGSATGKGTLGDPLLRLLGDGGVTLLAADNNSGSGNNAFIDFTPLASGSYFLDAGAADGGVGSYTLSAVIADAYAGNVATTGTLAPGDVVRSTLAVTGDTDWFAANLTAGVTYWFSLAGSATGSGTLGNPHLRLFVDDGTSNTVLAQNDDGGIGNNAFLAYTATASGTYYIAAEGTGNATGTYRLSMAVADDFAAVPATTGALTLDDAGVSGTIEVSGDADWFAVALVAGTTYWFSAEGSATGMGSLADPYLRLLGNDGATQVAVDDNTGTGANAFLRYTPAVSGTYFLSAQGAGGATGSYVVSAVAADDTPANTSTARTLKPGGSASQEISYAGDRDWFRTTLTAGKTYWFSLEGSPTGKGTLDDAALRLYAPDGGTVVASDNDGGVGRNAFISYTPSVTGAYFISAEGLGSTTGTCQLSEALADDFPATPATTGAIAPGGTIKGAIGPAGDIDWVATTLTAGTTYWFGAEGAATGKGTLVDPILRVLADDGATVAALNDDGGVGANAFVDFTPATSGTYFLAVQTVAGATGSYRVTDAVADDVMPGPATTQTIAVGGTKTAAIDFTGDADWFRITLTAGTAYVFNLEGSPTGQGTLANPLLRLLGDDGATLEATDNDSGVGLNALITYTPTADGVFFLSAQGGGAGIGTYRLSAGLAPPAAALSGAGTQLPGAANLLVAGAGAETLHGSDGADRFVFQAGQASGDMIVDFTSGIDTIDLIGFGSPAQGATFTQLNATDWQITPAGSSTGELLHIANAAPISAADIHFV